MLNEWGFNGDTLAGLGAGKVKVVVAHVARASLVEVTDLAV